jgi:hypothetical protein
MAPKCARSNGLEKWMKKWGEKLGLGLALRIKHLPRFRVYFY